MSASYILVMTSTLIQRGSELHQLAATSVFAAFLLNQVQSINHDIIHDVRVIIDTVFPEMAHLA